MQKPRLSVTSWQCTNKSQCNNLGFGYKQQGKWHLGTGTRGLHGVGILRHEHPVGPTHLPPPLTPATDLAHDNSHCPASIRGLTKHALSTYQLASLLATNLLHNLHQSSVFTLNSARCTAHRVAINVDHGPHCMQTSPFSTGSSEANGNTTFVARPVPWLARHFSPQHCGDHPLTFLPTSKMFLACGLPISSDQVQASHRNCHSFHFLLNPSNS